MIKNAVEVVEEEGIVLAGTPFEIFNYANDVFINYVLVIFAYRLSGILRARL